MATNPELDAGRQSGGPTVRRRGEVEVNVTADELVAAAINAAQNGWPLEALGHHWMKPNAATQMMLEQIYEWPWSSRQTYRRLTDAGQFHR